MKLLRQIFRETGASRIFFVYLIYFIAAAVIIWLFDPGITMLRDALWYCFSAATTIGFGDVIASSVITRIVTVILSVYSVAVLAVFTGVVTNYFMDVVHNNAARSSTNFLYELEHLPELSKEELEELSRRVKDFRQSK
ncbi:MAG: potassium channel family protein [Bilifractor sp.]|jgi:voltage-gated potassium channel